MSDQKRCTLCGDSKPLEDFSPVDREANSSGRSAWCRPCLAAYFRRRRAAAGIANGPIKAESRKPPKICRKCYGLPHRVQGERCKVCGLERGDAS